MATCAKCSGSGRFISHSGRDCGPCFACQSPARPEAPAVDADRLMAAFDAAAANGLKRPRMRFEGFTASLAPATGTNAGAVYIKSGDRYLGKVKGGRFLAAGGCDQDVAAAIQKAMVDPLAAAIAYGKATGSCSCCGRTLTDPVSVENGIGPICAEKFAI